MVRQRKIQSFFALTLLAIVVSDDDKDDAWNAYSGPSLPEGSGATHNGALSPLLIPRAGAAYEVDDERDQISIVVRGNEGYLWSSTNRSRYTTVESESYYLTLAVNQSFPVVHNFKTFGFSLRCLVSTTSS